MEPTTSLVTPLVLLALGIYFYWIVSPRGAHPPLPPGPSPLPLVGNLFNIPKVFPWVTYRALSKHYGKIISLRVFGQVLIVVDDADIAVELLEKRSAIYSSRPESSMIALVGWDWNFGLFPYGQKWRRYRRVFWEHFHSGVVSKHEIHIKRGVAMLFSRFLKDSTKLRDHIRYSLGAIVLRMTYGIQIAEENDKYINIIEKGSATGEHLIAGTSILEFIPALARLPTWLPGTSFLRTLEHGREAVRRLRTVPWNDTKQGAVGLAYDPNNITAAMREKSSQLTGQAAVDEEEVGLNVSAAIYSAAADTTLSTLCGFFIAMALYPDVQKKAQAELDAVVGHNRLPRLDDMDRLPYISAVIKETLRWHYPAPLGLPHVNTADDEYSGYFIPKGSVFLVNLWSIFYDESVYPEPDRFMPERFLEDGKLNPAVKDPSRFAFGFGRRICPGRYLADSMLFTYISYILHVFNITPPLDENGQPIRVELRPTSGVISYVEDCRCTIKPRSPSAETLIRNFVVGVPSD